MCYIDETFSRGDKFCENISVSRFSPTDDEHDVKKSAKFCLDSSGLSVSEYKAKNCFFLKRKISKSFTLNKEIAFFSIISVIVFLFYVNCKINYM